MRNPDKLTGVDDRRREITPPASDKLSRCGSSGSATSAAPPRCCARSPRPPTGSGLPPPAALIGEWFGSRAVIAPSLTVSAGRTAIDVFDVRARRAGSADAAVGGGWFGYLSYPDAAPTGGAAASPRPRAAGPTACCARTATGTGGTKAFPAQRLPDWLADALAQPGAAARLSTSTGATPTATPTARACWPAWRRSPRARSTRRACARSSPARLDGAPDRLLRRRRAHAPSPAPGGVSRRRLGRGGVAVAGAVPAAARATR